MSKVIIKGTLVDDFKLSHKSFGESFYKSFVASKRESGAIDNVMVIVPEKVLGEKKFKAGDRVFVSGSYRSRNILKDDKRKKIMFVFARELEEADEKDLNIIFLDGYICKEPVYRITPFGREIADLLVAVNRKYNKSDYISCICWGKNAEDSENIKVGTRIKSIGRVQSRTYEKAISETEKALFEVSEVSIAEMEVVNE